MCGIAGYSLDAQSSVDRTLAAQALLAGIAERGADAVGYAHRSAGPQVTIHKQRTGATALLDTVELPGDVTDVLVHVRDYTKGHPTVLANNHPIRHGSVVGIHNGIIVNDEEIFARHAIERAEPEMTVDSEAIFALLHRTGSDRTALEELRGSMATAWLDDRLPETVHLARGVARPLWIGRARRELFFASTKAALEVVESTLRLTLRKQEISEGRLLHIERGRVVGEARFRADRTYRDDGKLPAVRAPHEQATCLAKLADLDGLATAGEPAVSPYSEPSGPTATPSSRNRSRTRNWNAAHGPVSMSTSR